MSMFRNLIMISGGGSILPPAYQQVEYIESSGTQYIDTGVYGSNNTNYILEMELTTMNTNYQQFFAGTQNWPSCPKVFTNSAIFTSIVIQGGSNKVINDLSPGIKYKIEVNGNNVYFNDVSQGTITRNVGTDAVTHWIFNAHQEPTLYANMKLYRLQMDESGTPTRDFIPCYRKSDNETGLYDIVNDVFYTNAGTGTFIKGPNV